MQLLDAYPIIVTDRVSECRDFYTRWLGFQVAFEASWFVYLASGGERPHGIAFMAADHPSEPPGVAICCRVLVSERPTPDDDTRAIPQAGAQGDRGRD